MINARLDALAARNTDLISEIEHQLTTKLAHSGIAARVTGRRKHAYSVWRKMELKALGFEQLSDILGFRAIVKTVPECYQALGIVHTTWPVVPGRFKDYISTPKQNDYRSIHTTVVGPRNQRVELQIRTAAMNEIAEYGIAAHALYKDSQDSPSETLSRESNAYAWLRRTIELLAEGSNPEEFLEHTKLELFHDQVFCFTPMGKLIALPRNATPIDFAYAVHTDIGNHAVGCKVNGTIGPLISPLRNGDEVEILTSRAQIAPPAAWESVVVTGKARAAIRRATRVAVRAQYAELGRRIVERLLQSFQKGIFRRTAQRRVAAPGPRHDRRCLRRGRTQRDEGRRRRAGDVSRLQGGTGDRGAQARQRMVRAYDGPRGEVQVSRRQGRRRRHSDPRAQRRSAGPLRPRRRRRAGRPHRRNHDPRRADYHLPDPVPGAESFRGRPRAVARCALGCG